MRKEQTGRNNFEKAIKVMHYHIIHILANSRGFEVVMPQRGHKSVVMRGSIGDVGLHRIAASALILSKAEILGPQTGWLILRSRDSNRKAHAFWFFEPPWTD